MGLFSKKKTYQTMTIEEFKLLSSNDLFDIIQNQMMTEEERCDFDPNVCLREFSGAKRIFYIVNYFDMEVQNGGLCQFFVNSSRIVAPFILESLHSIEAYDYEALLSSFINKHHISLNQLDSFITDDIDEYEQQTERYPFDDFDDAYYELYESNPLQHLLTKYIKKHIEEFI